MVNISIRGFNKTWRYFASYYMRFDESICSWNKPIFFPTRRPKTKLIEFVQWSQCLNEWKRFGFFLSSAQKAVCWKALSQRNGAQWALTTKIIRIKSMGFVPTRPIFSALNIARFFAPSGSKVHDTSTQAFDFHGMRPIWIFMGHRHIFRKDETIMI